MDLTSGNVVGDYATVEEALDVIRRGIEQHGAEAMADYALAEVTDGHIRVLAMQQDLLERAAERASTVDESGRPPLPSPAA
jgi:hypothetical protein